jgi:hypothetical protein
MEPEEEWLTMPEAVHAKKRHRTPHRKKPGASIRGKSRKGKW